MAESKTHRKQVQEALGDDSLQTALGRAVCAYRKARESAMEDFDLSAAREQVRSIKERSISELDSLLARFKKEAEGVGAVVHEAKDAEAAAGIVRSIAEERGAQLIVKAKSMLTEEIELNQRLSSAGLEVVETDLGEWIVQLAGERPSHFTSPAMHKTREQVAELFSKETGEDLDADVTKLVAIARRQLRQAFIDADMGISGANIAIAETGTLVIVSNEGNARLVTSLPEIHVAIVGYEKLVPTLDDATAILKVLPRSATGQKMTAYVSFITGPSRTTDIEKTLALGVHGPKELHIIFVDAGRKAMAADEKCREALYCIKCGACLNLCPVYKSIGGHAYGNAYMGGIGAVVTAFHKSLQASEDTLGLCAGCGYCASICPSKIHTPDMVLELRKRLVESSGMPLAGKAALGLLRRPAFFQSALKMARRLQSPMVGKDGSVKELPLAPGWTHDRKFPGLAKTFLREKLPKRSGETGKVTAAFFAGCMIDFVYPEIGEAIWKVLTANGVKALFPREQGCCGAPAVYSGDLETARKLAVDNMLALEKGSPRYVVTGCPTCAVTLKEQFPALLAGTAWEERALKLAAKVMDFSQFAADVLGITSNPLPPGESGLKATYHDPCHLVRGLGTADRPRKLLKCAGVELVEMADSDECCGFAGGYSVKQAPVSGAILNRKIEHIEASGAGVLATDCPGCIMQIRGAMLKRGSSVRVCHTAELLADILE